MAARFCTSCGRIVPWGAARCPVCGAPAPSGTSPPGGPVPPAASYPGDVFSARRATPEGRAAEARGLRALRLAMLLAIGAGVVSIAEVVVNRSEPLLTSMRSGSTISLGVAHLALLEGFLAVAAILVVAELVALRHALRCFVGVVPGEETPASLALMAVLGVVVLFGGLALFVDAIARSVACAGSSSSIPLSCIVSPEADVGIGLLFIGGIVALVGYIGTLVGVFRLGDAHRDTTVKVGAVLLFFPYLGLIGALLLFWRAERLLDSEGPGPAGSSPFG